MVNDTEDQSHSSEELAEDQYGAVSGENQPEIVVSKRHKSIKKKRWLIALVVVLLLAGAASAVWWFWLRPAPGAGIVATNTDTTSKKQELPLSPEMQRFLHPTTGETWLAAPKALPKQGLYSNPDGGKVPGSIYDATYAEINYYEVGRRGDNTIILSRVDEMYGTYNLFERSPDGRVALIAHPLHDEPEGFALPKTSDYHKDVVFDTTTRYDSLSLPATITLDDGTVLHRPEFFSIGRFIDVTGQGELSQGETHRKVQDLGASKIYRTESSFADTHLTNIGYSLETPAHTAYDLDYIPLPLTNDKLEWLGAPKTDNAAIEYIKPIARGCGVGGRLTRSDTLKAEDLQLFKTSPDGQKVYSIKDANHPLWTKAYEEFKAFIKYEPENKYATLTKAQFIAEHAVMVYQDAHGEYLVYARTELAPSGGCAKPVVYLYPTSTTHVNVKVGADVKISAPFYNPQTGWDAVARPDGRLTVDGATYDSLFWEGPGVGQYPAIVSGTVVPRALAVATIRSQLAEQGFNQKETDDFVAYWQDKLPNKPYIRLSWLTTEQMNRLAPLHISPKPDTIIRTFLDFSGYDYPVSLPKQTFVTPERRGFTVTEWGGLSPYKLY